MVFTADQSLLRRQEAAGEMRYVMLENVREFAAGQLSPQSRAELQLRHAAVFLRRATVLNREAAGAGEAAALDQLEADLENIRAGMAYSCAGDAWLEVAGYAAATANFLWRRGHWQELADWFASGREALAMLRKPPPDLAAQLLYAATAVALDRGELGLAEQVCEEGLAAARNASDPAREAMFLNLVGILQRRRGDRRAATESCEQALALAQTAGDRRAEGMAWHNLGLLCQDDGEVQQAQEMYERALQVRQEANDTRGAAETLNNLATIAELGEQVQQAAEYFRQAVAAYLQLQDIQGIAISLCNLGEVLGMQGQASAAAELLQPAAQALNELGSVHAEAAQQMFETARAAGGPVLDLARLPWRRGLLEAARAATLEVPRLRRYSP
jgi:tetratricopeptide (TPR) repeat protein